MRKLISATLLLSAASACGGAPEVELARDEAEARSRDGQTTVWINEGSFRFFREDNQAVLSFTGRTSRDLRGVLSWVPDDAFGTATQTGPRTFEVQLRGGHEINSVLSGMPLLIGLDLANGTHLDGRLLIGASWARFRGRTSVGVEPTLAPIFRGDVEGPAYRARVRAQTPELTVGEAGSPRIGGGSGEWTVDFSYADLEPLFGTGARVIFQTADGRQRSASVNADLLEWEVTDEDAFNYWPALTCRRPVYECLITSRGLDFAHCGTYREVNACQRPNLCEVYETLPFSLAPIDLTFAFEAAVTRFIEGCASGGGQWCRFGALQSFIAPDCLAAPAQLSEVVRHALEGTDQAGVEFDQGQLLDRTGLEGTPIFSASYSTGGPALFQAIDGHFGAGEVQGWWYRAEVPCHNCTDFEDVIVLWYPEALRAVRLTFGHGYDS